ncbi:MAG: (2Fe-2S) ferredoxin domain-containing protein [Firmicutes bacterium]|nr:(2Fe-2S) ferredoxin domain-containing protein [Bacillota bacterium]
MLTIHVCIGSACHLKGAYNVINGLQSIINEYNVGDQVTVNAAFCLGECAKGVCVKIDDGDVRSVNEENMRAFFDQAVMPKIDR